MQIKQKKNHILAPIMNVSVISRFL